MSFITLIIITHETITIVHHHYRIIEHLLEETHPHIKVVKSRNSIPLDAGYILIDEPAQIIINSQTAFPLTVRRGFEIIYLH